MTRNHETQVDWGNHHHGFGIRVDRSIYRVPLIRRCRRWRRKIRAGTMERAALKRMEIVYNSSRNALIMAISQKIRPRQRLIYCGTNRAPEIIRTIIASFFFSLPINYFIRKDHTFLLFFFINKLNISIRERYIYINFN